MYLLKKHTPKNFFHFFFLEKMVCDNCLKFDKDCFEYKCNVFENRHVLVVFLINIVMNIQKLWEEFCMCDGVEICFICQANLHYNKYEHTIYQNCLNLDFLSKVRENLVENLYKLENEGHFVCRIINQKYQYQHPDWFTGYVLFFNLEHYLLRWEQKKINEVLRQKVKVQIEPLDFFFFLNNTFFRKKNDTM